MFLYDIFLTMSAFNPPGPCDLGIYYLTCINKYASSFTEYVPIWFLRNHHKVYLLYLFPPSFRLHHLNLEAQGLNSSCCFQILMASSFSLGDELLCRKENKVSEVLLNERMIMMETMSKELSIMKAGEH